EGGGGGRGGGREGGGGEVGPGAGAGAEIARIWSDVLAIEPIGAEDDFFELKGDSLQATRIIARLRARFRRDIPLRMLFDAGTVRGLALAIEGLTKEDGERIVPTELTRAPATPAQLSFYRVQAAIPHGTFAHMPGGVRIRGAVDVERLASAVGEVVARHAALRTVFQVEGGVVMQVVRPPGPAAIVVEDISDNPTVERIAHAIRREIEAPF